jgi:hypothetical protein
MARRNALALDAKAAAASIDNEARSMARDSAARGDLETK